MEPPLLSIRSFRSRRSSLFLTFVPVAFTAVLAVSSEARFLLRAGSEEAGILLRRRPIAEVVADPHTRPALREQLELVLAARRFAAERLGLAAGDTYTSFSDVGAGTTLLHVVSASPPDRLEAYRWTYPIVGSVPYKGFFEEKDARAEERRLRELGYDTYVRPAGAFSTLGWLPDPLLSTALDGDRGELVATVIHEIAHNTLWVRGDARFNESYANFVGYRGAEAFFVARGDLATARRCAATWRDEKKLATFYTALEAELTRLYSSGLSGAALEERRLEVFEQARATMAGPLGQSLEVYDGKRLARRALNNAWLIAHQTYSTGLDELDQIYEIENRDLRAGVRQITHSIRRHPSLQPMQALALTLRPGGSEEKVTVE
jgi:predicted aminopeptidase